MLNQLVSVVYNKREKERGREGESQREGGRERERVINHSTKKGREGGRERVINHSHADFLLKIPHWCMCHC
jgi:hypothetical protein